MSKKVSFGDKAKKKKVTETEKTIKVVFPIRSQKTGSWTFSEKFIKIPTDGSELEVLDKEYEKALS